MYSIAFFALDEVHLFIGEKRLSSKLRSHLSHLKLHEYDEAATWIANWLKNHQGKYKVSTAFVTRLALIYIKSLSLVCFSRIAGYTLESLLILNVVGVSDLLQFLRTSGLHS